MELLVLGLINACIIMEVVAKIRFALIAFLILLENVNVLCLLWEIMMGQFVKINVLISKNI